MSQKPSISAIMQRLSPRERLLGGIALTLTLVIGSIYGGLMPGLNAARSAVTRNADAAADLTVIRSLASLPGLGAPRGLDNAALSLSAEANGLVVVDQKPAGAGLTMVVTGSGPDAIIRWLAANASTATVDSFAIEPSGNGGVTGHVTFSGGAP